MIFYSFVFFLHFKKFTFCAHNHNVTTNNYQLIRVAANDGLSDLMPPDETEEIKDGQWMGVTVRSQGIGGKVSKMKQS